MRTTKTFIAVVFTIALFGARLAQAQGSLVAYMGNTPPGTIVVHTKERALYFLLGQGTAIRYPVAVPKSSMAWKGSARITGKYWKPAWTPPAVVKRDHPELADYF